MEVCTSCSCDLKVVFKQDQILTRQQQHTGLASRTAFGNTIRVYPDSCQESHSLVATSSHPLHLSAASCLLLEYHRVSARAIDQIPSKSRVSEDVPCQARNPGNKVPLYPCL